MSHTLSNTTSNLFFALTMSCDASSPSVSQAEPINGFKLLTFDDCTIPDISISAEEALTPLPPTLAKFSLHSREST